MQFTNRTFTHQDIYPPRQLFSIIVSVCICLLCYIWVFSYFKHHVYYVSINNFIHYVSINNFLEQHVYNNVVYDLDSGLSYFWHIIEYLEVS